VLYVKWGSDRNSLFEAAPTDHTTLASLLRDGKADMGRLNDVKMKSGKGAVDELRSRGVKRCCDRLFVNLDGDFQL